MSIDRVATAQQSAYFLSQINQAGAALDKTQQQIACGKVSSTYAGFGDQAQVLQATHLGQGPQRRLYHRHQPGHDPDRHAGHPADQPVGPGRPVARQAVSNAVANNDASTLMDQVAEHLRPGGLDPEFARTPTATISIAAARPTPPPVTVTSLSQLAGAAVRFPAPSPMATSRNRCRSPTARPSLSASPPPMSAPA